MKVLVTGFEPFGGATINPALEAVRRLPAKIAGADVVTVQIPVVFEKDAAAVDAAIDALDIQSWEVTNLPEGAEKTGSANISYSGTDATITTYDDPSVVTVTAMGQDITLAVPDSAQSYLPFLSYLG